MRPRGGNGSRVARRSPSVCKTQRTQPAPSDKNSAPDASSWTHPRRSCTCTAAHLPPRAAKRQRSIGGGRREAAPPHSCRASETHRESGAGEARSSTSGQPHQSESPHINRMAHRQPTRTAFAVPQHTAPPPWAPRSRRPTATHPGRSAAFGGACDERASAMNSDIISP